MQPVAFTIRWPNGIVNQLVTEVSVIVPNTTGFYKVRSIWDTGATASVVTDSVVQAIGLIPTGMSLVHTANGPTTQNTYIVDIMLPNGVVIRDVTVTGATALSGGCEALIGMDIISLGDFSITQHKGATCMSFRIPSIHEVDYVKCIDFKLTPNIKAGQAGSNFTKKKKKRH